MKTTPTGPDRFRDPLSARTTEWLVTNGRGGFAMGTIRGSLARRYHGLLVAAIRPPVDRWMLLAKLEPTLIVAGERVELSSNEYVGTVHPRGYERIAAFEPLPLPTWRFAGPGGAVVEQSLWMAPGRDATFVSFRLIDGPDRAELELRPLCTSRFMHHLLERAQLGEPDLGAATGGFSLTWPNRPPLFLDSNGSFSPHSDWYYRFVLATETDRGQSDRQDLFMPGPLRATLTRGDATGVIVAASSEPIRWQEAEPARATALTRATDAPLPDGATDPLAVALARATADFLVDRGRTRSVIAGYPWFGDWGRDTFISLPGLCLVTGRHSDARRIIETFASVIDRGMVPNRFPDVGEAPEYNTVDASLWFVHAVDRYLAYSGDWNFVAEVGWPAVRRILDAHRTGTRHQIRCDADGLLAAGEPGVQLTWMDAKTGDHVVTPRIGKPVEIQALWHNALRIAAGFAERRGERALAGEFAAQADTARASFNARFWNAERGCLFDVIDCNHVPNSRDPAIRPNQLFALSLPHAILDAAHGAAVVDTCRRRLLTPMGLRTLDPDDPAYVPYYLGDLPTRDRAYHQGTVWPWLLGAYVSALVRAGGGSAAARREGRAALSGLEAHLNQAGLGSVSEVADATSPHRPDGCPWQAWSVAEPLRALVEDVLGILPERR